MKMIYTLFISIVIISGMMILWIAVQSLWKKSFGSYIDDEDVLAGRKSCGDCACFGICKKEN